MKTTRLAWASALAAGAMVAAVALPGAAQSPSAAAPAASALTAPGKNITLMVGVKGDPFYVSMECGARVAAAAAGVNLDVQGPDKFDATLQNPMLDAVGAGKPDALLVAPNDRTASAGPLKTIQDGGAKIVLVDTTLENPDMAVSQIASDNEGGGRAAAKALSEQIGGSGKVFVVNVKPGISTTDLRAKGFQDEAKKLGLEYVGMEYNQDQPDKAAAIVKAQLAKTPDLKGIFATNLFAAEGSAAGLRESGNKDVKIVSFDAGPKQVEDLKNGTIQALVAQKPADIGAQGVQQAVAALKGETTKPTIATGSVIITKDNLAQNQDAVYKSTC